MDVNCDHEEDAKKENIREIKKIGNNEEVGVRVAVGVAVSISGVCAFRVVCVCVWRWAW